MLFANSDIFLKYFSIIPFCKTYILLSLNMSINCNDISFKISLTSYPIAHSICTNSARSIFFSNALTKLVFPIPHFPEIATANDSLSPWNFFNSSQILFNCLFLDSNNFSTFSIG